MRSEGRAPLSFCSHSRFRRLGSCRTIKAALLSVAAVPSLLLSGSCNSQPTEPQEEASYASESEAPAGHAREWGAELIWPAGSNVRIQVDISGTVDTAHVLGKIAAAAGEWNEHVLELAGHEDDLPHFDENVTTLEVGRPKIVVDYSESGVYGWCGAEGNAINKGTDSALMVLNIWK